MKTYVAFLRGINVAGHNMIKMEDLKKSFEVLFDNVRTYIQSGNVIFNSTDGSAASIKSLIENQIKESFGFPVIVILRTPSELNKIIFNAPYKSEMMKDTKSLYVMLLSGNPKLSDYKKIDNLKYLPDEFFVRGKEIYLFLPNGAGRTKLNNALFENKLKVSCTSRNWNTINELIKLTTL